MIFEQDSIEKIPYHDLRIIHRDFYEEIWDRRDDGLRFDYQSHINRMKEALYQHQPRLENITYQFISKKHHTEIKIDFKTKMREKLEDFSLTRFHWRIKAQHFKKATTGCAVQ